VFDAAERIAWERGWAERSARETAAARARYQRFRVARERWWLDRLGEVEFWGRRVRWLMAEGKTRSLGSAIGRLAAALERSERAEGFCTDSAP
jgi:hypothetical protein